VSVFFFRFSRSQNSAARGDEVSLGSGEQQRAGSSSESTFSWASVLFLVPDLPSRTHSCFSADTPRRCKPPIIFRVLNFFSKDVLLGPAGRDGQLELVRRSPSMAVGVYSFLQDYSAAGFYQNNRGFDRDSMISLLVRFPRIDMITASPPLLPLRF